MLAELNDLKLQLTEKDLRLQHYQELYEKEKSERERIQKTLQKLIVKVQLRN